MPHIILHFSKSYQQIDDEHFQYSPISNNTEFDIQSWSHERFAVPDPGYALIGKPKTGARCLYMFLGSSAMSRETSPVVKVENVSQANYSARFFDKHTCSWMRLLFLAFGEPSLEESLGDGILRILRGCDATDFDVVRWFL